MHRVVPFFNGCVSFVAFITMLALVIYMLIAFVTGTFDVGVLMFDTIFLESVERQKVINGLNAEFLHNVAVLLILMKAYRILVEYMKHHHIDIKFMVEIGIIACILELLFNSSEYTEHMQTLFAVIAVTFLGFYSFRYENLLQSMKDAQQNMKTVVGGTKVAKPVKVAKASKVAKTRTRKKKEELEEVAE